MTEQQGKELYNHGSPASSKETYYTHIHSLTDNSTHTLTSLSYRQQHSHTNITSPASRTIDIVYNSCERGN
jgi:hypothetical protein